MGRANWLSVSTPGGDSVALRDLPERRLEEANSHGGEHGNRPGLQQHAIQRRERQDDIPFELLVAFTRHLIRNTVGGDAMYLAINSARVDLGVSRDAVQTMLRAVLQEHATHSIWPKDF